MMFSPTRNSPVFSFKPLGVWSAPAALALLPCLAPALWDFSTIFLGSFHDEETGIPAYR
jgi:hypothetical protein